jgi:hypothetical protein
MSRSVFPIRRPRRRLCRIELQYDGDSLDFLTELSGAEAAEKFSGYSGEALLSAVKIFTYDTNPVTVKVYNSLTGSVLKTISNIIPNDFAWTKIDLDPAIDITDLSYFVVSVTSSDNSLGYSSALDGSEHAYLKYNGTFYDLNNFTVTDGSDDVTLTATGRSGRSSRVRSYTPPLMF